MDLDNIKTETETSSEEEGDEGFNDEETDMFAYECQSIKEEIPTEPKKPRVIIVGAGIAGLSAAEHMVTNNVADVLILEASNRFGGRIQTNKFGAPGKIVELGASYIYGANPGNCVYHLANKYSLIPEVPCKNNSRGTYHLSCGFVVDVNLGNQLQDIFKRLEDETRCLIRAPGQESLKNYLDRKLQEFLGCFPLSDRNLVRAIFNNFRNHISYSGGDCLDLMSAWGYGLYLEMPGEKVTIPSGFINLIQPLIDTIPSDCIKLNHEVQVIKWNKKGGSGDAGMIDVICSNGERFIADHLIFTVPLGVLKQKWKSFFNPGLPRDKIEAIERTGFGHVSKVFLEFEHPFWQPGLLNSVNMSWHDNQFKEMNKSLDGWVAAVTCFEEVPNNSKVLLCCLAGPQAVTMETLPEKQIGECLTVLLRHFLNDPSISEPTRVCKSSWCSDPFYQGGYSYPSLMSTEYDLHVLAKPLPSGKDPRVMFAGEATHPHYYSTVHGARSSGLREAERLMNYYKRLKAKYEDYINMAKEEDKMSELGSQLLSMCEEQEEESKVGN